MKPEPVWLITDACPAGVGAVLGQGPEWETCRPAGFMSKKSTAAQQNYLTYEHETLSVLEAIMKWENQLLGQEFTVISDHKALEFFQRKDHQNPRQAQWQDYFA